MLQEMRALSKLFSQFRERTAVFFFLILPETLKFTGLVIVVLWSSYKRARSKYRYMADIDKKSSKFIFGRKFKPVPELLSCSICLSEYMEGEVGRELQCKHRFHRDCLEKWLQECQSARCPMCRFLVLPKETLQEYQRAQNEHVSSDCEEEIALLLLSAGTHCRSCNGF